MKEFLGLWRLIWICSLRMSQAQQRLPVNPAGELTPIHVNNDACNKTVEIYTEVSSPPVTADNRFKSLLCHYRFRPFRSSLRDWVLRIRFTRFKVGRLINDTHCENAYFQIIDGNGKSGVNHRGREPGKFCGEIEQAQTFISETSSVRLVFSVDNYTEQSYFRFDSLAEQQYEVYLRYGQHPELYPNRRGEVSNSYCDRVFKDCRMQTYPGIYPRNLHCRIKINTRQPFTKLHLQNEEFNVDGQRCENLMLCPMKSIGSTCPYDYLRIYDGKDEESPVIGTFCGIGKFPFDIIGTSSDLFVEFVTAQAGPLLNTGFHFNVAHWPEHVDNSGEKNGTCDWIYRSKALAESGDKQGLFWSVSHWYVPNTGCSYLMLGESQEIVRLYFPSFRIDRIEAPILPWDDDCGESLTIYDANWADDSKIIKTFCDTFSKPMEKQDFISTGNALFVRFESKTGSYSGSSLYYWAHFDFFNNSHFGDIVPGTLCDEKFRSWNQPSGKFASPLNTLIYKSSTKPILCRYRFESTKRIFARVIINIVAVNFKYNQDTCLNCWSDRVDKVTLVDTSVKSTNASSRICICKESLTNQPLPIHLISEGEEAEVTLRIDNRHSLSNYFKYNTPVFEGTFVWIHPPLCGLTHLGPTNDGKLKFPFYYNPTLRDQPISCIWELKVHPDKDIWVHFKLLFSSTAKTCADAKLEFFLPGTSTSTTHFHQLPPPSTPLRQNQPLLTLCGDASMGDRKTEISSQLPILTAQRLQSGGPLTIRLDAAAASKVSFLISWTELVQLPKNSDGTFGSRLEQKEGFLCPGPEGVVIDSDLVCNGVINCPTHNASNYEPNDEADLKCKISSTRFLILNVSLNVSWVTAAAAGGGGALLFCLCCVLCCRCCRRKETELDY